MNAIDTASLTKYYGKNRGIIDIDLQVKEGEIFGFIGPNGAGKTTTTRLLLGLIRPTSGETRLFGKQVPAGGEYEGQLKYGVPEGSGRLVMSNGAVYEGEWIRGEPHGRGAISYPGGGVYHGEVRKGKRQGKGIYTGPDGKVYKGLWDNNKLVKAVD